MDFVYLYFWNFIVLYRHRCLAYYTGYTTLLWLKSSENLDPASVWFDSSSVYNDATNRTPNELQDTLGYRNTMIDAWTTDSPDWIRVSYLNADGFRLYSKNFNSTGTLLTDWFTKEREFGNSEANFIFNKTFTSYSSSFSQEDRDWGVSRYTAIVIPQYNGTTYYLVYNKDGSSMLPTRILDENSRCHFSYGGSNPFALNITVTNNFHGYCATTCREQNYPYGALHGEKCSCLNSVEPPPVNACNTTCAGNSSQTCGGFHDAYPADAIIFDEVEAKIDIGQFDAPLQDYRTDTVNGSAEISFSTYKYVYGYTVSLPPTAVLPITITMEMTFRDENCSSFTKHNTTIAMTFTVNSSIPYRLNYEPIKVKCTYIYLYDNSSEVLTFPVNMTTIALEDNSFVTASIILVDANWWIEPEVSNSTNSTDQCECECWVYNMLYGDSPYNNLTYTEIEDALRNVTEKLERELAVNKSELSSTIRSKTSADDSRASATAVGYTLGVALLTFSLGGIILADIPKLWRNLHLMRENLSSRFCRKKTTLPDVTITNTSDQTLSISQC